ncbi:MAG: 4Fe-4S dicluster domain-containing protein [Bacteroidota bacterium]
MDQTTVKKSRYGMAIDLDRCTGCGACLIACAVENNVSPGHPKVNERNGTTWMRVFEVQDGRPFPDAQTAFIPMMCQQCEVETPCVSVCPQNAVEVDPETGIVGQIPQRCLGCRYCMTACPYHARYYNWWDPKWPDGMEKALNPDVAPRMRGVVEKCNFCHGRLHEARARAAAQGSRQINPSDYIPACVEACPVQAITFGDLNDESTDVALLAKSKRAFRFLARLGTETKVYYLSGRDWVRRLADRELARSKKETLHG